MATDGGAVHDAKRVEESTKKARDLKKSELRWKLMQASQARNQAKLKDIQTALNYHKKKLSKAQELASKLRDKYLKVVESAKLSEQQYNEAREQFEEQERFVADEKMQLTKLALNCTRTGNELFGDNYKLPEHIGRPTKATLISKQQATYHYRKGASNRPNVEFTTSENLLDKLSPFLRIARSNANEIGTNNNNTSPAAAAAAAAGPNGSVKTRAASQLKVVPVIVKKRKKSYVSRLSSLYDLNESIFRNLASYRLTRKFAETGASLTGSNHSHNISPLEYVCLPDLLGECCDKSCLYQHKSNYQMTNLEKLADILSYKPSIAGFTADPNLSELENERLCRNRLKQMAATLISLNADKSVEVIAKNVVKRIRGDELDMKLILSSRQVPKTVNSTRSLPLTCSCQPVEQDKAAPVGDNTNSSSPVILMIDDKTTNAKQN